MGDSQGVAEERVAFTKRKLIARYSLRYLVATNAPKQKRSNKPQTSNISHGFHTPSNG
jgi:hypothetical protein